MLRKTILAFIGCLLFSQGYAQVDSLSKTVDSTRSVQALQAVTLLSTYAATDGKPLPEVAGIFLFAGKKTSLVLIDQVKGNIINNTMRQVLAKVPGIHIWESDGSGIQVGIATRGLSANRSWEFNVRQNGYDIAADPYGYPEAYYSPPLQVVQRIEVVRGHGALQYGPQFGGMVNYVLRDGADLTTSFQGEVQQSLGSNGLFNIYTAAGGKTKKWHYYAGYHHRTAQGYRLHSNYFTHTGFASITYQFSERTHLRAELTRAQVRSRQPGGLPDSLLFEDPKQSLRSRNWMDIQWTTAALTLSHLINENHKFRTQLFALRGDRNSVGFMPAGGLLISDTPDITTGLFAPRSVHLDRYRNIGLETRYLGTFFLLKRKQTISAGLRLFNGNTFRFLSESKGSRSLHYDITIDHPWDRDLDFNAQNVAAFAESRVNVNSRLILIPGVRYEYLVGGVSGQYAWAGGRPLLLTPLDKQRGFVLAGMGAEYHLGSSREVYANITQAYRPLLFADLAAAPTVEVLDPQLKDASGYNCDLGFRGRLHRYLFADVSLFWLQYNNRVGVIAQQRQDGTFYNYRTNVGYSVARGIETYLEASIPLPKRIKQGKVTTFMAYAYTDARYGRLMTVTKNASGDLSLVSLLDRKIENAPAHTLRAGTTAGIGVFFITAQWSYVSSVYSDANNTIAPSADGQRGLIPAYSVMDLTAGYSFSKTVQLKAGLNNVLNEVYFTRRASGYPGPGALPADGRAFFLTLLVKSLSWCAGMEKIFTCREQSIACETLEQGRLCSKYRK